MRNLIALISSLLYFLTLSASASESLLLRGVNVVDVVGLAVIDSQAVHIEDGRIRAIGDSGADWASADLPEGTVEIDMTGKYLVPGLIDAHVHHATDPENQDRPELTLARLRALLRGGVTSVRDMGGDARTLANLKRLAEIDAISAPDIHYSVILGGHRFFSDARTVSSAKGRRAGDTHWMRAVDGNTDYDAMMLRAQGAGASGVKAYAYLTEEQLQSIAAAAREHGLPSWSHAYHRKVPPSRVVAAGFDVISHAPYLAAETIPDFRKWHRDSQAVEPELLAASYEENRYLALFDRMAAQRTILDATLSVFELTREGGVDRDKMYRHAVMFTRMAHQRGIRLVAGTDVTSDVSGLSFPAVHYEMQLLVRDAGLTPLEALQAATLHGAMAIGIAADQGSVEVGKVANLLVLDANPAEDIKHSLAVAHVLKNGRFVYRGSDPRLPFTNVREGRGNLWLSGQIGNFPGTLSLAGESVESQTRQAMRNIGYALEDYGLDYDDLSKCTLMLGDIADWASASEVYKTFFHPPLPARSAFAASGLAMGARIEVECVAEY